MIKRRSLFIAGTVLVVLAAVGVAWALCPSPYNRPGIKSGAEPPVMDYVPQEIGIYDTMYWEQTEHGCRKCHGNSTADRHHYTPIVLRDQRCTVCHSTCEPGSSPDCPDGILIIRDCLTSGCHSWADVGPKDEKGTFDPANVFNGWHHATDMAASENCIACHDPNLVAEITPFRDHERYPATVLTPTPFSCENCHWEQQHSATGDPCAPGHPSTYDHSDYWGNFIGFHEYSKPIYGNFDTHHMGFKGFVVNQCYKCHSQDPDDPSWDPFEPELMRYCMICHDVATLHTIAPHVNPHPGWVATGYNTPTEDPINACLDLDPTDYRTADNLATTVPPLGNRIPRDDDGDGVANEDPVDGVDNDGDGKTDEDPVNYWGDVCAAVGLNPEYSADEQCLGCHGTQIPPWVPEIPPDKPAIAIGVEGMQPIVGSCGAIVTLRGTNFGEEHVIGRKVQMRLKPFTTPGSVWLDVPIHAWTDTLIEFEIPCWTFVEGNYAVRVCTEVGCSNRRTFTVNDHPTVDAISPDKGPCAKTQWLTLTGTGGFGSAQDVKPSTLDGYHGIHRMVDFVASSGEYTVTVYRDSTWSDTSVQVKFWNLFEDQIDTCGEPTDLRNFVQDDGTADPCTCPDEPIIPRCDCVALGIYSVYFKSISYGDEDGSDSLTCADTIFQVEKSDAVYFELTNDPVINKINPRSIERYKRLKIYGLNFGPQQDGGEVRIGTKNQYNTGCLTKGKVLNGIRSWSNTLIRVKIAGPVSWEGSYKYVWVVKNGVCSNKMRLKILVPLP